MQSDNEATHKIHTKHVQLIQAPAVKKAKEEDCFITRTFFAIERLKTAEVNNEIHVAQQQRYQPWLKRLQQQLGSPAWGDGDVSKDAGRVGQE